MKQHWFKLVQIDKNLIEVPHADNYFRPLRSVSYSRNLNETNYRHKTGTCEAAETCETWIKVRILKATA